MEEKMIEGVEEQALENLEDTGKIVFSDEVVATIASLAASEVEGIAGMSGNVVSGISERFGKKSLSKGVKVVISGDAVSVDASVNVKYGYAIHTVCEELQVAMKNAVETMTGLSVSCVNINVVNVIFEKPAEPETDTAPSEKAGE